MGGTIIGETRYKADGTVALWMRYNMDADGSIYGISTWYPGDTSWTDYYFVKNLQGDVIQVRKASDNSVVASYTYDAWGNVLSESGTLAHINRFRYRGYYYDEESALYYLQSRYYDPALGRFINADAFASTGQGVLGNNMFAYCGNNPVNCVDPYGYYTDGQIHDMVLEEISRRSGYKYKYHRKDTLVIYPVAFGLKWFGFCDLYDPDTGETWELKKNTGSSSCRTESAKRQLDRYINGSLASDPQLELKYPTTTIRAGNFDCTDPSGTQYWVSYWDEGGGILRYQYFEIPSQYDVVAVAIIAGVFISSITVQEGCRVKVEQNYHD